MTATTQIATGERRQTGRRLQHMRIAVSYYCSLHCQHCYVPELNRTRYRTLLESSQLSLDTLHGFIDRLIGELGLEKVTVTGGEALLRPVWSRASSVVAHSLRSGLDVQLNTSGSGQIQMAEVARTCGDELPNFVLHLSLDGIDEQHVDRFRGKKGAMRGALKTLDDAIALGMKVDVRYTMTQDNAEDTVPCYELVSARGAQSFVMKPMFAAGTARENQDILIRSREEVRNIQWQLLKMSVGNPTALGLPEPVYVPERAFPSGANAHVIKCACGGEVGYLSTNGDVYPCSYIVGAPDDKRWVLGNIMDPDWDFFEAWRSPGTYASFRNAAKDQNCTAQNIVTSGLDVDVEAGPAVPETSEEGSGSSCQCGGPSGGCSCSHPS